MKRAACWVLLCSACGGGAFAATFREREDPEFSRVLEQIAAAPAREERAVVVAVAPDNTLVAWDLREGRRMWSTSAQLDATPLVAGRFVVATEGGAHVVRRLADGERAFAIGDGELRLVGADGEGEGLVISLARGGGDSPQGVLVGAEGGVQRWVQELPLPVATPALIGGVVIVPWAHQRVSFLASADGTERARLRLEDAVVGHVLRHGEHVLLGQHEVFRLAGDIVRTGRRGDVFLRPQGRPLPGQPPLLGDGYQRRLAPDSARNRIRLSWTLASDDDLAFSDGILYFVFYRMVFGFESGSDEVRWVQVLDSDAVGAEAGRGGLMVATEDGNLRLLRAEDGREVWRASMGSPIRAAEIRLAGFLPEAGEPAGEAVAIAAQLERAAGLEDARLDSGRALAIRYLARIADDAVTQRLIALCAPRAVSGPARRAACDALAARETGANHVREALREQASFLEERPPPPVGALARAAATMNQRNTVPLLLRHLEDPATPVDELPGLFDGLGRLGDARTATILERFVRLYHADATDSREADAVAAAARALLALAPDRLSLVQELSSNPLAPQTVRDRLARAMTEGAPQQPAQQGAQAGQQQAAQQPRPQPQPAQPADDRPERITNEIRHEVLRPVEARLRRCLEQAQGDPLPSARISMIIDNEGSPQTVSVMPTSAQECMEPLIRSRTFPRTRRGSEALIHVVRR